MKYYKPEEVAEILQVSVDTIRRWYREGKLLGTKLTGHRCLRISEASLEELMRPTNKYTSDAS